MKYLILIGIVAFAACHDNNHPNLNQPYLDSLMKADSSISVTALQAEKENNWNYYDDSDKMDGSKTYIAENMSTNIISFSSPYDVSNFRLRIFHRHGQNELLLSGSSCQFLTGIDGGTARVKFDAEKPMTISTSEPSDYSSDRIFLESAGKLISKMRNAKKMTIEAEFYRDGKRQIDFDVDSLKWTH